MSGCVLREWAGAGSKVGRRGGGEVVDSGELEEAGGSQGVGTSWSEQLRDCQDGYVIVRIEGEPVSSNASDGRGSGVGN